jgi:hypothetical protein
MRSPARRGALLGALLAASSALPALAAIDPYAADPLGIIAYAEQSSAYSRGADDWEVWVCDVPDGSTPVLLDRIVADLNATVTPYFLWLSGGAYTPTFRAGGTVVATSNSGWSATSAGSRLLECENRVALASTARPEGVVVVADAAYDGGYGTGGAACLEDEPCPVAFPDNGRIIVVGGGTVVAAGDNPEARLLTVAHEVGHGIFWPHSFGGLVDAGGFVWEYDNPMDIMSGATTLGPNTGTLAINRYAAGWIGAGEVVFHRSGTAEYRLGPIGSGAAQFLVLPDDGGVGVFDVISPRVTGTYDRVPEEGLEVYRIDQRGPACGFDVGTVCWGPDRRTSQVPAVDSLTSTAHVHGVGETFSVRGVTVEVTGRAGDEFTVRVGGAAVRERFVDDNGTLHEANIAAIAERGITVGCNPPRNDRFCPGAAVTRAEMAAFLLRAIGQAPTPAYRGYFTDVPAGQWFTPWVERLFELGIASGYGDGTYRPTAPVSRAEMAALLLRALGVADPAFPVAGVFADVPAGAWFAPAVEQLRAAEITAGCATGPLRFCPADAVLREQMATFLARAFGLGA